MSKYICVEDFANELKNFACRQCKENKEDAEGWKCVSCSVMYLVGAIDAFSAADVEPVIHAKWIVLDDCSNAGVYCSNCHKKVYKIDYPNTMKVKSKYCPNCGAKMDQE